MILNKYIVLLLTLFLMNTSIWASQKYDVQFSLAIPGQDIIKPKWDYFLQVEENSNNVDIFFYVSLPSNYKVSKNTQKGKYNHKFKLTKSITNFEVEIDLKDNKVIKAILELKLIPKNTYAFITKSCENYLSKINKSKARENEWTYYQCKRNSNSVNLYTYNLFSKERLDNQVIAKIERKTIFKRKSSKALVSDQKIFRLFNIGYGLMKSSTESDLNAIILSGWYKKDYKYLSAESLIIFEQSTKNNFSAFKQNYIDEYRISQWHGIGLTPYLQANINRFNIRNYENTFFSFNTGFRIGTNNWALNLVPLYVTEHLDIDTFHFDITRRFENKFLTAYHDQYAIKDERVNYIHRMGISFGLSY